MLPHLNRVLFEYDNICTAKGEPKSFPHELAATLLSASRYSTAKWKMEAVTRARKLLEHNPDNYLNAWLELRESFVMRMSGSAGKPDKALQGFVPSILAADRDDGSQMNARYNAQRGELVVSFAENLIQQGKLGGERGIRRMAATSTNKPFTARTYNPARS